MKKLTSLLCAFVLVVLFNSCSSSSDDSGGASSADKAVGTWKYIGDMSFGEFNPYEAESCDDEFLKFFGNNSGQIVQKYCGEPTDVGAFTWEKTSDPVFNYTFSYGEGATQSQIFKFSDDFKQFTIYQTEENMLQEEDGEVYEKQ
jgi:hypothetical protein